MYRTEYGRLYFAMEKTPMGECQARPPRDLAGKWFMLCDSKHALLTSLTNLTLRWSRMLISTVTFLTEVAHLIRNQIRGALPTILLALSQAMRYRWEAAIRICKPLLSGRGSSTWKGRLLLQIASWQLNGQIFHNITSTIRRTEQLCPGWSIDSLKLSAAVQLGDRGLLSEAAYWFEERYSADQDSVATSVWRRKSRIRRNIQSALPSYGNVPGIRGLHFGEMTRRFLMWK